MYKITSILMVVLWSLPVFADKSKDQHYTDAGFFDIHVCNWPDRPPFYLALLSTERFDEIESVRIEDDNGAHVGDIGFDVVRKIKRNNKPEKRVFISHFPVPDDARDGWFQANIVLDNGERYTAKDYVSHQLLGRAQGLTPGHTPAGGAQVDTVPSRLQWHAIEGAGYYQVFIRDKWDADKLIHSSKLIRTNHYDLPEGLLEEGGYYAWKVHARDVNEHIELGDFNLGSQSEWVGFMIE